MTEEQREALRQAMAGRHALRLARTDWLHAASGVRDGVFGLDVEASEQAFQRQYMHSQQLVARAIALGAVTTAAGIEELTRY